jgi:uncharacterized 2Fe-2S/4Fe-4S cluster protein (DUF4445 family)
MKLNKPSLNSFIKTLNFTAEQLEDCLDDIICATNKADEIINAQVITSQQKPLETSNVFLRFKNATLRGNCTTIKNSSAFCLFAITLGEKINQYINELFAEDPFLAMVCDNYANFCLHNYTEEAVSNLATQLDKYVVSRCVEIGNDIFSIDQFPAFFNILKQDIISLTPSHLMIPQKSVAYLLCLDNTSSCHSLQLHNCETCSSKMCSNRKDGFYTITVITEKGEDKIQAASGTTIDKAIHKLNLPLYSPCGGNGTCGKCKIKIVNPLPPQEHDLVLGENLLDDGYRLACRYKIIRNEKVYAYNANPTIMQGEIELSQQAVNTSKYCIAVDIGTTTIVAYLIADGKPIDKIGFANNQSRYGSDVVSRIEYCVKNGVSQLHNTLVSDLNTNVELLCERNNKLASSIELCFVCGNTVMEHTLLNKSISGFASVPFTSEFLQTQTVDGSLLGLNFCKLLVVGSNISAFIGADIVAGVVSTRANEGCNILLDLGTNGEIVLSAKGKLFACSTAAGPALEGGELECGMSGVEGAIHDVEINGGVVTIKHYGIKPTGICGSGVLKAIAEFVRLGIIDETGRFVQGKDPNIVDAKYYLTQSIYISQKDIRAIQLAKSAIYAGIETLIEVSDVNARDIQHVYIAGGFGNYIQKDCLFTLGLLRTTFKDKIVLAGNTSVAGAIAWLVDDNDAKTLFEYVAQTAQTIELNNHPAFLDLFIEGMNFEQID